MPAQTLTSPHSTSNIGPTWKIWELQKGKGEWKRRWRGGMEDEVGMNE
jgi:hypothetical protein